MARAALRGRLSWQLGRVVDCVAETERTRSLVLDLPDWPGHRAGQHLVVRLTAEDGYRAQRSYSIASAPGEEHVTITVERLMDGEVSPYLVDVVEPGDELEVRGPIGGYFVWDADQPGPVLLIAGGSGVVPMRAILRHWASAGRPVPVRLVLSARSLGELIYRDELLAFAGADVRLALTREWDEGFAGHRGRIDAALLEAAAWPAADAGTTYICGPTGFVETAADTLVALGHDPARIKTERFGPTG